MTSPRRWRRLGLVAGGAVLVAAVGVTIRFDLAGLDATALAARVRGSGALGPAVILLLLIIQSIAAPLPSQPMLMAAGFVYGPGPGFVLGWLGVLLGASACFGLARALGRPFVERMVRAERLSAVDQYVSGSGTRAAFFTVLTLRLFAHIAFDIVSYSCGVVRFSFMWFLLATAIGEVPKVFLFTYLGAGFAQVPDWLGWLVAAGILGTFLMLRWLYRRAASSGVA